MKQIILTVKTTGLTSNAGIMELSAIIVHDDNVVDELHLQMNPTYATEINPDSLKYNGVTVSDVQGYPDHEDQFDNFVKFIDRHVDKYNKMDKLTVIGWNVRFAIDFLRDWFLQNGNTYYGSYFYTGEIDLLHVYGFLLRNMRHRLPNFKADTIARLIGVELKDRDSLTDVYFYLDLYNELTDHVKSISI